MKQQKAVGQGQVRCHAEKGFAQGQWGATAGHQYGNIDCESCLGRMVLAAMMEKGSWPGIPAMIQMRATEALTRAGHWGWRRVVWQKRG